LSAGKKFRLKSNASARTRHPGKRNHVETGERGRNKKEAVAGLKEAAPYPSSTEGIGGGNERVGKGG